MGLFLPLFLYPTPLPPPVAGGKPGILVAQGQERSSSTILAAWLMGGATAKAYGWSPKKG
jgi:hypothetical protein